MAITPKPVLIDRLVPDLGGKVVKLVIDDMERARLEREERKKRKEAARSEKPSRGSKR